MVEEKRTMLKLTASEDSISLRTVSRGFRPPQRFVVLETELQKLEKERHVISSDIRSFAEMNLVKADTEGRETILVLRFTWLCDAGGGKLSGTEETLRFPWNDFRERILESRNMDGAAVRLLSLKSQGNPTVEFHSRGNLKAVAGKRVLRKKLGKFLSCHFAWKGSRKITVTDDFVPYSFYFQEERANGAGICGGIILHGQDDMKKARYEIHT